MAWLAHLFPPQALEPRREARRRGWWAPAGGGVGSGLGQECTGVCYMEEAALGEWGLAFGQISQLILSKLLGILGGFMHLRSPTSMVHNTHQPQKITETASMWKKLVKC